MTQAKRSARIEGCIATARLAAQYDTYKPFPDLAVNGKQTLNENIADLAGLTSAYDAYRASLAGKAAPVQNALSGDQQFFLSFAQNWASKSSEAFLREQMMTDTHSPDQFRPDKSNWSRFVDPPPRAEGSSLTLSTLANRRQGHPLTGALHSLHNSAWDMLTLLSS